MPDAAKKGKQELEDLLVSRLNLRGNYPDDVMTENGPVPLPPPFRKPTMVVGTDLANKVEKLYKMVPELRGRAKLVSPGFTPEMIQDLLTQANFKGPKAKKAVDTAKDLLAMGDHSNIVGLTNPYSGNIYVSSSWEDPDVMDTIAHEYQHLAGMKANAPAERELGNTEAEATKTGGLFSKLLYGTK